MRVLAEKSGISEKLLLEWVNHADLCRLDGVAGEYADLLEAAGVDSVPELAQRNAANLSAALEHTNETKHAGSPRAVRVGGHALDRAGQGPAAGRPPLMQGACSAGVGRSRRSARTAQGQAATEQIFTQVRQPQGNGGRNGFRQAHREGETDVRQARRHGRREGRRDGAQGHRGQGREPRRQGEGRRSGDPGSRRAGPERVRTSYSADRAALRRGQPASCSATRRDAFE